MDRLTTLACSMIVILGSNDTRYLPGCEYLAQRTGSELAVIREAGHMVHRDQADAVNDVLIRFLTGLES